MSREIKFRYVFKRKTDGHIYIIEFNVEALEDKSVSQIKTMLRNDLWKLVARDQFTGLKDKNELELYADDIIDITRYEETTRHQIIWKEGGWQLYPPGPFPTQYLGCFKSATIEKKGNIYENKNLLRRFILLR